MAVGIPSNKVKIKVTIVSNKSTHLFGGN
jgi:hypothetical protein